MTRTNEPARKVYLCQRCNRTIQRGSKHAVIHAYLFNYRLHPACADLSYPDAETLAAVPDSGACGWPELVDDHAFMNGR